MGKNNLYVEYLLGDLESYIISQKAEINSIINEKKELTLKDSAFIFDRFSKSLKKTTDLIKHINEVEDAHLLDTLYTAYDRDKYPHIHGRSFCKEQTYS